MNKKYKEFKEAFDKKIKEHKGKIIITSHKNPDPDSIASVSAMYSYLVDILNLKNPIEIAYESKPSEFASQVLDDIPIEFFDILPKDKSALYICVDVSTLRLVTENLSDFSTKKSFVCIDHHQDSGEDFLLSLIDDQRVSCAEILYDIFFSGTKVDSYVCKIILAGILTDSGGFSFVTSEKVTVFNTVAEIISEHGVSIHAVKQEFFGFEAVIYKPLAEMLANYCVQQNSVWGDYGYTFIDATSYTDDQRSYAGKHFASMYISNTKGTKWGYRVTKKKDAYGISFRSSPGGPDVSLIAKHFGGGGHKTACGAEFKNTDYTNLSEEKVNELIEGYLKTHKPTFIK